MRVRVMLGAAAVFVVLAVPAAAFGSGWSRMPTPNPLAPTGQLDATSCPSATTCIGVGTYVNRAGIGLSLAERWNGKAWRRLLTPNPAGALVTYFQSVSCPSSTSCLAVGLYLDASGANHGFAERWNGTGWRLLSVPEPIGSQSSVLFGISCLSASSCIAVGGYTDSSGLGATLVETWNGSGWTVRPTPNPPGAQSSLLSGVACTSPTACTAVGGSDQGVLAERWNGTTWTIQTTPSPGTQPGLFSVSCTSASACIAVGTTDTSAPGPMLAEQWDGTSWSVQPTPEPAGAQGSALFSVSCSSASACTAVGAGFNPGNDISVAERWDGNQWSLQSTPNSPGGSELGGVACPGASGCIAVGFGLDASGTLMTLGEGWDGAQWTVQPTDNPVGARGADLAGVTCNSASSCVAVGQSTAGTLAELWDGTAWSIAATPNPPGVAGAGLNSVSCAPRSTCFAVGVGFDSSSNSLGTITERGNGTSWRIQPTPSSGSPGAFLNAVSCTSPSACTAVGNNAAGAVMAERWNGASWRIQPMPAPPGAQISFLTGVSCTSATACTAVGGAFDSSFNALGTVTEQWNGTGWTLQPTPTAASPGYTLNAVSCTSASACTAVGNTDSGLLAERWDGTAWTVQSAVTPPGSEGNGDFFSGVSCSSSSACTAAGLVFTPSGPSTIAERWRGTSWTVQPTPNLPGAYDIGPPAVSCPTQFACTAVGAFITDGPRLTLAEQWNGVGVAAAPAAATQLSTPDREASRWLCPGFGCARVAGRSGGLGLQAPLVRRVVRPGRLLFGGGGV